jgi:putative toxin-antitoxin system antitoxin component (TIGR02293 family)
MPGTSHPQAPPAGLLPKLSEVLGVRAVHTEYELAALAEKGLPPRSVDALLRAGLESGEAYQLILPRRTLAHRTARKQLLSREESDKAIRVGRIAALAEEVFGDRTRAWAWLRRAKQRFGGRTPIEMIATETGARLVEEMLWQIDDGMAG